MFSPFSLFIVASLCMSSVSGSPVAARSGPDSYSDLQKPTVPCTGSVSVLDNTAVFSNGSVLTHDEPAAGGELSRRADFHGQATWFTPGLGACGWYSEGGDHIAAMNAAQFDGGATCGKWVDVWSTKTNSFVSVLIVDLCPGCGHGSLDLSPSAFQKMDSLSAGVQPITWSFQ